MNSYYLYQRQYRETGGAWKNTSIYSVDGWQTQEKVVAQIDPSECDEWNPDEGCKAILTLEDCTEVCIPCDGSRSITRADLGEYKNRAIIAEFGCCIDTIDGVFQGDTKIKKVIIPDCITAITEASFYGTKIEGLVIPASVTYIGSQVKKLAGLKWARFLGTVPPTLAANCSLGGNCPIYVPPAYVNVYKAATIWSNYADRIQPWQGQVETDYDVDCTVPETTYEIWLADGTGFTCSGTTKYHVEYKWTSATGDDGSYIKTNVSRRGDLWEYNSTDCGYVPASGPKYTYSALTGVDQFTIVSAECDSSSAITSGNILTGYTVYGITIGDCVTDIGPNCFWGSWSFGGPLEQVIIGPNVQRIGSGAFNEIGQLTGITIPDSVISIGNGAFNQCGKMEYAVIGNGLTIIPETCFSNCGRMSALTIGNSVEIIESSAFNNCSGLTSLTLPDSLTTIGANAFLSCTAITGTITIPSGVTSIGNYAFYNVDDVDSFVILATTPPNLGNHVFKSGYYYIYVPAASVEAYKAATNWSIYANWIRAIGS